MIVDHGGCRIDVRFIMFFFSFLAAARWGVDLVSQGWEYVVCLVSLFFFIFRHGSVYLSDPPI